VALVVVVVLIMVLEEQELITKVMQEELVELEQMKLVQAAVVLE
jgi:hypothetical protein